MQCSICILYSPSVQDILLNTPATHYQCIMLSRMLLFRNLSFIYCRSGAHIATTNGSSTKCRVGHSCSWSCTGEYIINPKKYISVVTKKTNFMTAGKNPIIRNQKVISRALVLSKCTGHGVWSFTFPTHKATL